MLASRAKMPRKQGPFVLPQPHTTQADRLFALLLSSRQTIRHGELWCCPFHRGGQPTARLRHGQLCCSQCNQSYSLQQLLSLPEWRNFPAAWRRLLLRTGFAPLTPGELPTAAPDEKAEASLLARHRDLLNRLRSLRGVCVPARTGAERLLHTTTQENVWSQLAWRVALGCEELIGAIDSITSLLEGEEPMPDDTPNTVLPARRR